MVENCLKKGAFMFRADKEKYSFADLVELMAFLRSADGCAWDRAQTLDSLRKYLLDECYEAVLANILHDRDNLREELGDLLLQIVFQAQLASEEKYFDIEDVIDGLCQKLIFRHSHIFGSHSANTPEEVKKLWEQNKSKEKINKKQVTDIQLLAKFKSPSDYPPLAVAELIQKQASKEGFDWENAQAALGKVKEELGELEEALDLDNKAEIKEELADLYFALINVSRKLSLSSEDLVCMANVKFARRYQAMKNLAESKGLIFNVLEDADRELLWNEVKRNEDSEFEV